MSSLQGPSKANKTLFFHMSDESVTLCQIGFGFRNLAEIKKTWAGIELGSPGIIQTPTYF